MAKNKRPKPRYGRDAPAKTVRADQRISLALTDKSAWQTILCDGYHSVMDCSEIRACVDVYADLISVMTIKLMKNEEKGDVRVKNELSRRIDIAPHPLFTRTTWIETIVRTMLTRGNCFVYPTYRGGYLDKLLPVPPLEIAIRPETAENYSVSWRGKTYTPDEVINFVRHPDPNRPYIGLGYTAALSDVVKGIRQANATKIALQTSPAPSIIDSDARLSTADRATAIKKAVTAQRYGADEPLFFCCVFFKGLPPKGGNSKIIK